MLMFLNLIHIIMSKNSMDRAFGVTSSDCDRADTSAELMSIPYEGEHLVEVMKATYREAGVDKEGEPIPASLHLFCRVPLKEEEGPKYDPRPVNIQFMNWNPESERAFKTKMGHLFRALGTKKLSEMKGKRMLVTLKRKEKVNPNFFHSYMALRTEPVS